jgi:hypothetical protein
MFLSLIAVYKKPTHNRRLSATNISFLFGLLNPEDEGTMVLKMSETTDLTTQCHIQKTWVFYQQISETFILQQALNLNSVE